MDWIILESFFLVFVRATAFMISAPFFYIRSVPSYTKVGFGFAVAVLLFPVLDASKTVSVLGNGGYLLAVAQETLVGLILGFTATLVFSAIRIGGEFIDLNMGFAMASLFDPASDTRTTLVGQFLYIVAMLLFFLMDGPQSLLLLLSKSYSAVPVAGAVFKPELAGEITGIFSTTFALGLKIAAPIIAVTLISDIALSLVSRTVPQLNVFIMGFPLKIIFGSLALIIFLPYFSNLMEVVLEEMGKSLVKVMGTFL